MPPTFSTLPARSQWRRASTDYGRIRITERRSSDVAKNEWSSFPGSTPQRRWSTSTDHSAPREQPDTLKLSILIVSFNTRNALAECLSALASGEAASQEVFVVDNASSDGSAGMVRADFPRVRLIENTTNRGFGVANNQALQNAAGELVLFLNSDARLEASELSRLVALMDADASIGALGPQLLDAEGHLELSFGRDSSLVRAFLEKLERRLRAIRFPLATSWLRWRARSARDVDWVSGACLLTRRSLLYRLGGFDPRFFLYMEDVDLCRRIREAGYRVRFEPSIHALHLRGLSAQTSEDSRDRARLEGFRSRLEFFRKYRPDFEARLYQRYLRLRLRRYLGRGRPEFRTERWQDEYRRMLESDEAARSE